MCRDMRSLCRIVFSVCDGWGAPFLGLLPSTHEFSWQILLGLLDGSCIFISSNLLLSSTEPLETYDAEVSVIELLFTANYIVHGDDRCLCVTAVISREHFPSAMLSAKGK